MVTIKFTYITKVNGTQYTKNVKALDYKTALGKFEKWAKTTLSSFCILGEEVIA